VIAATIQDTCGARFQQADRADLVQEAIAAILANVEFKEACAASAYGHIAGIARKCAINTPQKFFRRHARRRRFEAEAFRRQTDSKTATPPDIVATREIELRIVAAIARLPELPRRTIQCRLETGTTFVAIAAESDVSRHTLYREVRKVLSFPEIRSLLRDLDIP
jgi:RNA polymerase sigma factor (sigma-70 family)